MSWLVTARTHTEISDAISQVLQDTAESKWADDEKNQSIKDALAEISRYVPYIIEDTSKTMTGGSKELDVSDIKDVIEIVKAEYPVDNDPINYRSIAWIDAGRIRVVTDLEPTTSDACYLTIKKRHHLDPLWVLSTAYVVGDIVSPTKANRTGYRYECTTAGQSGSSEPSWGTTAGGITSDSGATWTCRAEVPNSLKHGANDLEDLFIELVAARLLHSKALNHINKINVGSAKAMEQYMAAYNMRLGKVLAELRARATPNTKQWYPTR